MIKSHEELSKDIVMRNYAQLVRLRIENMNLRGWLMDILKCIDRITGEIFSLEDMYIFADELSAKHIDNHNIMAKIRQQLQFLRDKGFIKFLGGGTYRKILSVNEINAAYEGRSCLAILEAKREISEDFITRQLYYPFRMLSTTGRQTTTPTPDAISASLAKTAHPSTHSALPAEKFSL